MTTLYVLRHAKSSWDDPALADRDRPLAPRGERAAARIATYVARERISPALVLCSPAVRARETLEAILPELRSDPELSYEAGLYGAYADGLVERLRAVPDAVPSVLLVGHNPGLHELVLLLADPATAERPREKFPTGALATLEFSGSWSELAEGEARLVDYVVPRELR